MTIPPEPPKLPEEFGSTGDPFDENPFPANDVRHEVWIRATREAEEEIFRFTSQYTPLMALAQKQDFLNTLAVAKFDAWAKRGVQVLWSDGAVRAYDRWLVSYSNAWLSEVFGFYESKPPPVPADHLLGDLRARLARQVLHWKAEARRYRAEQVAYQAGEAAATEPTPTLHFDRNVQKVGGPKLAAWLKAEMVKHDFMAVNGLHEITRLDRQTIKKMLAGKPVRAGCLDRLAHGLGIAVAEIPTD